MKKVADNDEKSIVKVKKDLKLTEKQALFCLEYCANNFNATEAAKKAGYSEKTAGDIAAENLGKPIIQARIRAIQKNRMARLNATGEFIIKELLATLRSAKKAKDHAGQNRALELLGRAQGMFLPDNARLDAQITVKLNFPPKEIINQADLVEIDPDDDREHDDQAQEGR